MLSPTIMQVDSWFTQRGYTRTDYQYCEGSGISYETQRGGLRFGVLLDFYLEKPEHILTAISYHVCIPALSTVHNALVAQSSFFNPLPAGNVSLLAIPRFSPHNPPLPWRGPRIFLERTTLGPRWQELLDQLEQDLPEVSAELTTTKDLCAAIDESPYWQWTALSPG